LTLPSLVLPNMGRYLNGCCHINDICSLII
jgi:hypothetical protein